MKSRTFGACTLALSTFLAVLAQVPARAETVGKLTAVQTQVSRSGKELPAGTGISLGDTLVSDATGLGMIVFNDQSSARLGPNSQLTIDTFVFNGGSGSAAVRMDRGVSRFFGGKISKKGDMTVRTPHVVLAVRGGIIDVEANDEGTSAILRAGKLSCQSTSGATLTITKPGFSCLSDGSSLTAVKVKVDIKPAKAAAAPSGNGKASASTTAKLEAGGGCAGSGGSSSCATRAGKLPSGPAVKNAAGSGSAKASPLANVRALQAVLPGLSARGNPAGGIPGTGGTGTPGNGTPGSGTPGSNCNGNDGNENNGKGVGRGRNGCP